MSEKSSEAWKALKRVQSKNDPTKDLPIIDRPGFNKSMADFINKFYWPTYQARHLAMIENAFSRLDAAMHNILDFELNEICLCPNDKTIQQSKKYVDSWKEQLINLSGDFPLWEAEFSLVNTFLIYTPTSSDSLIAKHVLTILKIYCEIPLQNLHSFSTLRQNVAKQRKSLDAAIKRVEAKKKS